MNKISSPRKFVYWHNKHRIDILADSLGNPSSYTVGITKIIFAADQYLRLKVIFNDKTFEWKVLSDIGNFEINFQNKVFKNIEDFILDKYLGYTGLSTCVLCNKECLYRPENLCKACMISEGYINTNNKRLN